MTTPGFPNPGTPSGGAQPAPGWSDAAAGISGAPVPPGQTPPLPGQAPPLPAQTPPPGWSDAAAGYAGFGVAAAPSTGRATATFVWGLIGLVGGIVFGWGFPAAIIALVLAPGALRGDPAGHARARHGRTLAVAGLIATVLWAGYSVLRIVELILA